MKPKAKKPRGFAAMSPEKAREVRRKGGKRIHELGLAHEYTSAEAKEAGRKGGMSVSKDSAYMAEIGRRGGSAKKGYRSPVTGASSDD